ncbi:MAG TPA: SDR family oxidoreductase [Actinomycetota bacterium]|nr:SDR family oxidoreductase [Actinomycetota bacterium]
MDLGLSGKAAWVLGGSSGLGRGSAAALAREGARVAISARDEQRLQDAATALNDLGGTCIGVPCDVSDASSIDTAHAAVTEAFGPIDILVANAGGPPKGTFDDLDEDALYGAFTLTTASAWRLTKAVVPAMQERGSGVVIFIASSSTKEVIPGLLLSNMMRAAVVGMAKTLSKELGPRGIRVLCVSPGRIDTPRVEALDVANAEAAGIDVADVKRRSENQIPLGRYGTEDEFGAVVAFLASERASYMNGTNVLVDGGMLNGLPS